MTETVDFDAHENRWNDAVVTDTLFSPLAKGLLWAGYAIFAVALFVMSILSLVFYFSVTNGDGPGSLDALLVFSMIHQWGTLVFGSGMVAVGLLPSRTPEWARVTSLSVAALVFLGSNALSGLFLFGQLL